MIKGIITIGIPHEQRGNQKDGRGKRKGDIHYLDYFLLYLMITFGNFRSRVEFHCWKIVHWENDQNLGRSAFKCNYVFTFIQGKYVYHLLYIHVKIR